MTAIDAPPLILLSETNDLLTYFYPFETICACPREGCKQAGNPSP